MELQNFIEQNNEIHNVLLDFIKENDNSLDVFENLRDNTDDLKLFLYLLSKISKNHFRNPQFFQKIEEILIYLEESIKSSFSNSEIFKIFKRSKRILLFLFERKVITPDSYIIDYILKQDSNYTLYFYNAILPFANSEQKKEIENIDFWSEFNPNTQSDFDTKCKIGENDSYVCALIRQDLVTEFVIYSSQANFSLSSTIEPSIFETNSFLMKKEGITLIEYAAFFGSIQIFNYLRMNGIDLKPSLWLYAIHGCNEEIIKILEDNHVEPEDKTYNQCLCESIKCHHNQIVKYIQEKSIDENNDEYEFLIWENFNENIFSYAFRYYNYEFFPDDLSNDLVFGYLCMYDYFSLVKNLYEIKGSNLQMILKENKIINQLFQQSFHLF